MLMINFNSISLKCVLLFIAIQSIGFSQKNKFEPWLKEQDDVKYIQIESNGSYDECYKLLIKQPLDHWDESKGHFYQKVYVSHKSSQRPNVIVTEGYNQNRNITYELSQILNANQIIVEHRFFGESLPDSMNYQYLNLKQACADLHAIRSKLGSFYKSQWLSTGISKGGATTIFYRYFYPDDVTVSVPYVAPINREYEEKRIYHFLDTVGTDECRSAITSFQKRLLTQRDKMISLMNLYSRGANAQYKILSLSAAFEYAVLEFPFSFWQYGHDCSNIPADSASAEEMAHYLLDISDITFFSDNMIERYCSHYYQSATEMGYYGYQTEEFKGLLKALPTDSNPHATFFPFEMKDDFNIELLNNVNAWLDKSANKMIYIYGSLDTWSASAVPYNPNLNSVWFMMNGLHHGNARIHNMTQAEQIKLINTLEDWLSIKIN